MRVHAVAIERRYLHALPICEFDPQWKTSTVVAMARQMHTSRDFGAMPILADALMDAGCGNADLLVHLRKRDLSEFTRSDWVLIEILGFGE